jgi:hypothetical protein
MLQKWNISLSLLRLREVTWTAGSCKEDSERHVMEVSSLIVLHTGNLRHLRNEGSANKFIVPEPVLDISFCHVYLKGV